MQPTAPAELESRRSGYFANLIQRWVTRRLPPQSRIRLGHKNVFILPTRWGLMFLMTVVLVLIAGINYQNSMILATSFLFFAVFVVHIHMSFNNFAGLTVAFHDAEPAHVGEEALITLTVCSTRAAGTDSGSGRGEPATGDRHVAIQLGWPQSTASIRHQLIHTGLPPTDHPSEPGSESELQSVTLPLQCLKRGIQRAPRLLATSVYPLGLVRVWSWLDLDIDVLVYPRPIAGEVNAADAVSEGDSQPDRKLRQQQPVDFDGLRNYELGESRSRIAWKKYAQQGVLYTKLFSSESADPVWIDQAAYAGRDIELQMSNLCAEVLVRDKGQQPYGLKLGKWRLAPGLGPQHKRDALEALARYPELTPNA